MTVFDKYLEITIFLQIYVNYYHILISNIVFIQIRNINTYISLVMGLFRPFSYIVRTFYCSYYILWLKSHNNQVYLNINRFNVLAFMSSTNQISYICEIIVYGTCYFNNWEILGGPKICLKCVHLHNQCGWKVVNLYYSTTKYKSQIRETVLRC